MYKQQYLNLQKFLVTGRFCTNIIFYTISYKNKKKPLLVSIVWHRALCFHHQPQPVSWYPLMLLSQEVEFWSYTMTFRHAGTKMCRWCGRWCCGDLGRGSLSPRIHRRSVGRDLSGGCLLGLIGLLHMGLAPCSITATETLCNTRKKPWGELHC